MRKSLRSPRKEIRRHKRNSHRERERDNVFNESDERGESKIKTSPSIFEVNFVLSFLENDFVCGPQA